MPKLTAAGYPPLCEICDRPFEDDDLEDGVTVLSDCCEQGGMCRECRKPGNHDCDDANN